MIDELRPYPEMKATGLPWLPNLPEAWKFDRAKNSFREVDIRSARGDEELLSVSHKTGVTPRSRKNITMFMAETYEGHRICHPGDVVVNTMWAWMAALGVSRHLGIVSPAYGVYRARVANRFEPRYLDYVLRTEVYRDQYARRSRGIATSRLRLYSPDFLEIPFVQPPPDEQRLIVRFLDWHGLQTTKLVRAKKKLVALLNEQRQAIINDAVSRGRDSNVQLNPSSIISPGHIPEGWEVRKIRHCGRIVGGVTPSMDDRSLWNGDVPWVTPKDMKRFTISAASMNVAAKALEATSLRLIAAGSVLLVVRGMILARRVPIARTDQPVTINQDMKAIVPFAGIDAGYLAYRLDNAQESFASMIDEAGHGTKRLPTQRWREMQLALPPLVKQRQIVQALDSQDGPLSKALRGIATVQREVELLHEYRARLVADVISGKLDVRAVALTLPQIAELDRLDEFADDDACEDNNDDLENAEVAA